jgi:hypothetical protein
MECEMTVADDDWNEFCDFVEEVVKRGLAYDCMGNVYISKIMYHTGGTEKDCRDAYELRFNAEYI